ncbi:MAG: polysaccharide pyruvyl transferase family protein [Chloroflexota bacterium]
MARSRLESENGAERRICVLGNFSGRNAGDMAILEYLMRDVQAVYPNVSFVVPTINPDFIRDRVGGYPVRPVSLLPWALSVKMLGLPALRAVLGSHLVLVTDNILFDMQLFNPLLNYLSTLSLILPLAARRGVPIVLYNASVGPISTRLGRWCLERVIAGSKLVVLRDRQSFDLIQRLGIPHPPVEFGADCALNVVPCSTERLEAILASERLFCSSHGAIGFNVNSYMDAFVRECRGNVDRRRFCDIIAATVDRTIAELGTDVLFVVTQSMDTGITEQIISGTSHRDRVRMVSSRKYSHNELAGIIGRLELMVAMRTHGLIFAASLATPVVGIISYPKTAGFLHSINQDRWMIDFSDLEVGRLFDLISGAYQQRSSIRSELEFVVQLQKERARDSALLLAPFLSASQSTLSRENASTRSAGQ